MSTVEFQIPSDPRFSRIVRSGVNHLCSIAGLSKKDASAIALAVDEAISNIIKHAYQSQTDKPIFIRCLIWENRLEFVLRDYGRKTIPAELKSRQLDDIRPGGLGVHFIRSIMDNMVYENSLADGNQLILTKFLPGKEK